MLFRIIYFKKVGCKSALRETGGFVTLCFEPACLSSVKRLSPFSPLVTSFFCWMRLRSFQDWRPVYGCCTLSPEIYIWGAQKRQGSLRWRRTFPFLCLCAGLLTEGFTIGAVGMNAAHTQSRGDQGSPASIHGLSSSIYRAPLPVDVAICRCHEIIVWDLFYAWMYPDNGRGRFDLRDLRSNTLMMRRGSGLALIGGHRILIMRRDHLCLADDEDPKEISRV